MKIIQMIMSLFSKHKDKLPDDMNSVDEIKAKAQELMTEHGDKLDQVADKIPGDVDDKVVDTVRDALKK